MRFRYVWVILLLTTSAFADSSQDARVVADMIKVGPGLLKLSYPSESEKKSISLDAFLLDRYPVTNEQFLGFVRSNPKWRRDQISRLFADQKYLSHWQSALNLGQTAQARQPVTWVSWFAAKAYCEGQNSRLPTENEWEFAAQATKLDADGSNDPEWKKQILAWYAKPNPKSLPNVGSSPANFWGVHDLHGLVWEWVLDFNSTMFSVDNRGEGDADKATFCGSGSLKASDKENYPSFMRFAFRSSLEANYTTANLGFRCARDLK